MSLDAWLSSSSPKVRKKRTVSPKNIFPDETRVSEPKKRHTNESQILKEAFNGVQKTPRVEEPKENYKTFFSPDCQNCIFSFQAYKNQVMGCSSPTWVCSLGTETCQFQPLDSKKCCFLCAAFKNYDGTYICLQNDVTFIKYNIIIQKYYCETFVYDTRFDEISWKGPEKLLIKADKSSTNLVSFIKIDDCQEKEIVKSSNFNSQVNGGTRKKEQLKVLHLTTSVARI